MDETRLNLTRRFATATEAREEAESNLSAGSVWVPLPAAERPALLRAVHVTLVLPDGAALDALRGRVTCVAPTGVAVVLDDLPDAMVLTRLLGGAPPARPAPVLAPEDAPPLPEGLAAAPPPPPVPTLSSAPPAPAPPPSAGGEAMRDLPAPKPGSGSFSRSALLSPDEIPASFDAPATPPATPSAAPAPTPAPPARPPEPDPAPPATDEARPRAATDQADFPMLRDQPVPAVEAPADMWADADLVPALKEAPLEEGHENLPEEASPRATFTVKYADAAALEKAWTDSLGAGRVLVPTAGEPPPLDAPVEVTIFIPDVGAVLFDGTVVHRASGEVGIRLQMDVTTRALIESALPSSQPGLPPSPPASAPVASVAPAPNPAEAGRRPSLELRTSPLTGKTEVVVTFESLADFRREYETNIRRGGVMVPTPERPPVRSKVEVVFSLLGGKREVRLLGEVVLHGPTGIGVQLGEIPTSTRMEIDALLAAATPVVASAPDSGKRPRAPTPPPAPAAVPAAAPRPLGPPASIASGGVDRPPAPSFIPSGKAFEGELVEVSREAEVEGEAGVVGPVSAKSSWLKVLAHLQATRSTGVLQAVRKGETKSMVIFQGRVVDSKGDPPRDDEALLRVIRKHNLAKPGVLRLIEKAIDKAPNELEALRASKLWSASEIDRARRWQILDRTAEVFAWEKGGFRFDPNGDRTWSHPTPGVLIGHVILHGVRSFIRGSGEDLARLLRPGLDRLVRINAASGFEPTRVGMSDKELKFWADIDGTKTLRQLLATTPMAQSQTHRLVFALCRLGVLTLERGSGSAAKPRESDRVESLRARAAEMKTRDLFGRLGISWMSAAPQVQAAWDTLRRELEAESKSGPSATAAREVLSLAEDAYRQLMNDRTRRLERIKIIEDLSRIEAAADMLAERAELLRIQGDIPGASAALQMAIDMSPDNPSFQHALARLRAS